MVVGMAPMNVFETDFNFKIKQVNLSVYKKLSKKTAKKLVMEGRR